MNNEKRGRGLNRALALMGAAALALAGVAATSTAASAADQNITPPQGGGSIVVHKHAGTPGSAGNGTELTGAAAAALGMGIGDVGFTIQRVMYNNVPIDLSTSAGWQHISDTLTPAQVQTGNFSLDTASPEQFTSPSGVTTFSGLQMGLYLVTETTPPANATVTADPFLVTVPHANPVDKSWIYNVHVYPKNRLADNPSKTVSNPVSPDYVVQGETVTWTLTVPVPRPPVATGGDPLPSTIESFVIQDMLDSRLTFVPSSLSVTLGGSAVSYFTVTNPDPDPAPAGNNNTLTLDFEVVAESGDRNVQTGQIYVVTFETIVTGAGEIPNHAIRVVNGVTQEVGSAQVNFGKLKVVKVRQGTTLPLSGAQFALYKSDMSGDPLLGPLTTTSTGEIVFDAIALGTGTDKEETFCIFESVPPTGYSVSGNGWTCGIELKAAAPDATVSVTVDNPPRTTPNLPLTGSSGTVAFMIGGLSLLAIAAGAATMVSRRKHNAAGDH